MINNPNTGLAMLLKETSPNVVQSSPSIFPTKNYNTTTATITSQYRRDPPTQVATVNSYHHTPMTTIEHQQQ